MSDDHVRDDDFKDGRDRSCDSHTDCHDRSGGDCGDDRGGSCKDDRSDSCSDGKSDSCCDGHHKRRRRRRRHHCLIPVGRISIDCSPVSFTTPGQARNILSCAVDQVVNVPVTQTTNVQVPTDFGCFLCVPVTQTVEVPVTTTVNVPPVLVPFPKIVCPPQACPPCPGRC